MRRPDARDSEGPSYAASLAKMWKRVGEGRTGKHEKTLFFNNLVLNLILIL